jgi:hypothetical protein
MTRCRLSGAGVLGTVIVGLSPKSPVAVGIWLGSTGLATSVSAGSSGAVVVAAVSLLAVDSADEAVDDVCDAVFASVPQEATMSRATAAVADSARARARMQFSLS